MTTIWLVLSLTGLYSTKTYNMFLFVCVVKQLHTGHNGDQLFS